MSDDTRAAPPHLTKHTQDALRYAEEEHSTLHLPNVGAACILLGVLREEQSIAARVLRDSLGLTASRDQLRQSVRAHATSPMKAQSTDAGLTYDQVEAHIVHVAAMIAEQLGHHYIGTEHILLGLVQAERNSATELLAGVGLSTEKVQQSLLAVLRANVR